MNAKTNPFGGEKAMNATTNDSMKTKSMTEDERYQQGKLYQFDGNAFVPVEISNVLKVPVTQEAMEAVKRVRNEASRLLTSRPELQIVASALLLLASEQPNLAAAVKAYGAKVYGAA